MIDGLAAGESFFRAVPVSDGVFAHLPAEQNYLAFDFAGEIQQADINIFYLYADGVDFGKGVFGGLLGLGALGFSAGGSNDVNVGASVEEDAVGQGLHLGFDFFHNFLAGDGGAQQGFEHGQQRMGFVEGKSFIGHSDNSILPHHGGDSWDQCVGSAACILTIQVNSNRQKLRSKQANCPRIRGAARQLSSQPALALTRIVVSH